MRQAELHLESGAFAGLRGAHGGEDACRVASGFLRGSVAETRACSIGRTEETSGGSMEEKSAAAVAFVVPGTPVGKGRPKFARRGNFVSTYTPEKTASYENLVKVKAQEAMQGRPVMDGPVSVDIELYVTPPASWSLKKQRAALLGDTLPTAKPDMDNVIKGLFDACNEIVWKDDKQVVQLMVTKRYAETADARMRVTPL